MKDVPEVYISLGQIYDGPEGSFVNVKCPCCDGGEHVVELSSKEAGVIQTQCDETGRSYDIVIMASVDALQRLAVIPTANPKPGRCAGCTHCTCPDKKR